MTTPKCFGSGLLVEDVLPKGWEFDDRAMRDKMRGSESFAVACFCGKTVLTVLRGNNWRVPAHKVPAKPAQKETA